MLTRYCTTIWGRVPVQNRTRTAKSAVLVRACTIDSHVVVQNVVQAKCNKINILYNIYIFCTYNTYTHTLYIICMYVYVPSYRLYRIFKKNITEAT